MVTDTPRTLRVVRTESRTPPQELTVVRTQSKTPPQKVAVVRTDTDRLAETRSKVARQAERQKGRPVGEPMTAEQARRLTDNIKTCVQTAWTLIEEAYLGRAWVALGYESWDVYCIKEFGTARLRIPREERPEMVKSLRDAGLSIRAISSATGASTTTVQADLHQQQDEVWQSDTPDDQTIDEDELTEAALAAGERTELHNAITHLRDDEVGEADRLFGRGIVGIDGKTYAKPEPKPSPPVPPLGQLVDKARRDIRRATDSLLKVVDDPRFEPSGTDDLLIMNDLADLCAVLDNKECSTKLRLVRRKRIES